jgi:hypothetical protein
MVQSHAIRDATATVIPSDSKARQSKPLHDDHHVVCYGALCIGRMIWGGGWTTTTPVATQIGADDRTVAGKQRRDAAPHQVCPRKTMPQEDRRPGAGPAHKDPGLARLDLGSFNVIHHDQTLLFPQDKGRRKTSPIRIVVRWKTGVHPAPKC